MGLLAIGLSSMGLLAIVVSWFVVAPGAMWRNGEPGLAPFIYPKTDTPNYPFNAVARYEIDFDDLEWKPASDPGESLDWLAGVSASVQHRLIEISEDLDMKPAKGLKFEIATATNPDDHTMKTEIAAHAKRERGYEQELSRARDEIEKVLDAELGKKVKNRSWRVSMSIEPEVR